MQRWDVRPRAGPYNVCTASTASRVSAAALGNLSIATTLGERKRQKKQHQAGSSKQRRRRRQRTWVAGVGCVEAWKQIVADFFDIHLLLRLWVPLLVVRVLAVAATVVLPPPRIERC